jgi:hypothetical protein
VGNPTPSAQEKAIVTKVAWEQAKMTELGGKDADVSQISRDWPKERTSESLRTIVHGGGLGVGYA